jgi:small GTP-binding protein
LPTTLSLYVQIELTKVKYSLLTLGCATTIDLDQRNGYSYSSMTELPSPIKILLIGDCGVGKTSLLLRYTEGTFTALIPSTLTVDYKARELRIGGKLLELQVWDTAGQERFRTITATFYRDASGVMLVYDCTNQESFDNLQHWLQEVDTSACETITKVLVANKCDLDSQVVPTEKGQQFADELGISFFEASSKEGTNVDTVFMSIATEIQKTQRELPQLVPMVSQKFNRAKVINSKSKSDAEAETTTKDTPHTKEKKSKGFCYL